MGSLFHITNNVEVSLELLASDDIDRVSRYALVHLEQQCQFVQRATFHRRLFVEHCCISRRQLIQYL
jgi:hypothetical protein